MFIVLQEPRIAGVRVTARLYTRFLPRVLKVLVILVADCAGHSALRESEAPPRVGQPIPKAASPLFVFHQGGLRCAGSVLINEIEFNFDVWCGKDKILYVQTLDPKFVTKEGLRIGATLRDAVKIGGRIIPSGECGVILPSGWVARPAMGADTRGTTRAACEELLDEEITYFDTPCRGKWRLTRP